MKIIFCGNNMRSISCLSHLIKSKDIDIKLVVAHFKNSKGYYKSIKDTAKKNKIKCISPKNINSSGTLKILKSYKPDLMVLVGYSQNILKAKTFEIPKFGTINLHASPLPMYRGAAPLNWMVINGEKKGGISIIQVDKGVDTGAILEQKFFKIKENENINELTHKVNNLYPKLLLETIKKINTYKIRKKNQNINSGSFFSKRFPRDGYINFHLLKSIEIDRLVRGLQYPFPGAFFYYKNKKIIVHETKIKNVNFFGISGRISKVNDDEIVIIARDKGIAIKKIIVNNKIKNVNYIKFKIGEDVE